MLKVGDNVTVYKDPIGQKRAEGKATIVKIDHRNPPLAGSKSLMPCRVRFIGQKQICHRILTE